MTLVVLSFLISVGITWLMRIYAQGTNLLDVPNQRSSHQVATPRGGGLGIVIVFLGAVSCLYAFGKMPVDVLLSLSVGGILVAGIGFIDDHRHVPAQVRFLVHFLAATIAVVVLGGFPEFQLGGRLVDLGVVGDLMAIVFLVWLINLYNFMDGIDGIAAVESICIVLSALLIGSFDSSDVLSSLLFVFAGASFGFLVWNWPPAKIFLGDVGSGFAGFVLAVFAIISSEQGVLPIWCWLILAGVFVVDATTTLVTRVINGEKWYSAHNNHAYQKLSRRLQGHRPVTIAVLFINIIWLLPIAWFASMWPEFGWWLTLIAWSPLIALAMYLKAGQSD